VTNSKTSVSKSREGRRWVIFAAACIAFVFCLIALWLLLTADALATLGFTGWLAVKCIRTKGEDPFYEPNQLDPP
jgi:hypothetical protein